MQSLIRSVLDVYTLGADLQRSRRSASGTQPLRAPVYRWQPITHGPAEPAMQLMEYSRDVKLVELGISDAASWPSVNGVAVLPAVAFVEAALMVAGMSIGAPHDAARWPDRSVCEAVARRSSHRSHAMASTRSRSAA